MASVQEHNRQAQEKAEQIVASIPLLPEVDGVDVKPYTDNTGDDALQLVFRLRPGILVDQEFIKRFNEYSGRVQTAILHSGVNRFPYTRLKEVA